MDISRFIERVDVWSCQESFAIIYTDTPVSDDRSSIQWYIIAHALQAISSRFVLVCQQSFSVGVQRSIPPCFGRHWGALSWPRKNFKASRLRWECNKNRGCPTWLCWSQEVAVEDQKHRIFAQHQKFCYELTRQSGPCIVPRPQL